LDYVLGVLFSEQSTSEGMPVVDENLLAVADVARCWCVTDTTAYPLAQSGHIPAFKVGWVWRFREAEIRSWLEERRQRDAADAKTEARRWRRRSAK